MVTVPDEVLARYERFSLYNSPYRAHDRGCAVDLYPGGRGVVAPSPVAGTVTGVRTVRCPPKHYAAERDHVLLVEVDAEGSGLAPEFDGYTARILHVDPSGDSGVDPGADQGALSGVAPGDRVAVGDPLGETVRSGFFGQWVDDHLHLEFRPPDADPYRASGSVRVAAGVDVEPLAWDGTGTVVETGPTHALLDAPAHTGDGFAALASDEGVPLDGGLVHYAGGGTFTDRSGEVSLLGTTVGEVDGRDVAWADVAVLANGEPVTGLSLLASRVDFGAKLVQPGHDLSVGKAVSVAIEPTDDPVRLG